MMVSKITEAVIYETPDGGETIYVRGRGETHRELHRESATALSIKEKLKEDQLWNNIRRAAETNATLKQALEEAIMIYQLSI